MFKWIGRNIGYILNPVSLVYNPPGKAKNKLSSDAKKNLEKYMAETGKPPPSGTLLSMQSTQPVGSVLNFGGFSVSNDSNNPLKGQTGLASFAISLDKSKSSMNVSSVLSPELQKAGSMTVAKTGKTLELEKESKDNGKAGKVDNEILSTISPTVTTAGNSGNNSLAIAGLALLGLFFIAK